MLGLRGLANRHLTNMSRGVYSTKKFVLSITLLNLSVLKARKLLVHICASSTLLDASVLPVVCICMYIIMLNYCYH